MTGITRAEVGRWLPVAACAAVIFALSSIPNAAPGPSGFPVSNLAHPVEYGTLAALIVRGTGGRLPGAVAAAVAIAAAAAYGVSDEWHQSFVPGRDPSVVDFGLDVAGAFAAAAAGVWLRRRLPPATSGGHPPHT